MSVESAASPAVPWNKAAVSAAAPAYTRKYPATPEASAFVSEVIAAAVATPDDEAPKAVALNVSVPRSAPDEAVATVAGIAPSRIAIVPAPVPPSTRSTIASHAASLAAVLILKLEAMMFLGLF